MSKVWTAPTIETLNVNETAFGPNHPTIPDGDLRSVKDDAGTIIGWLQPRGDNKASV